MRKLLVVLIPLLAVATLLSCSKAVKATGTDPNTKVENQLKGSISGTVKDTNGLPISGVSISTDSVGLTATTDTAGRYTIQNVPGGTWNISFHKVTCKDSTIKGIELAIDENRTGVDVVLRYAIDTTLLHQVSGDTLGSIGGWVRDTLGHPIQGINVLLSKHGRTTTTDSVGAYTLSSVIADTGYSIDFSGTGYITFTRTGISVAKNKKTDSVSVVLQTNDTLATIKGVVRDSAGAIAGGVTVSIPSQNVTATSDAVTGQYSIRVVAGTWSVHFAEAGVFLDTSLVGITVVSRQVKDSVNIRLRHVNMDSVGTITGAVHDTLGAPIQGITVTVRKNGLNTQTLAGGTYTLSNVLADSNYIIDYTSPNYLTATRTGVTVTRLQTTSGIDMVLQSSDTLATITGTVRDTLGAALGNVTVSIPSQSVSVNSDATAGTFSIRVKPGTWSLNFAKANYIDTIASGVTVGRYQVKPNINAVLRHVDTDTLGTISGTVHDSVGGAISGASVTITGNGLNSTSGVTGTYTITSVPAGTYSLSYHRTGFLDSVLTGVTLAKKQALTGVNMMLKSSDTTATVSGTVRDTVGNLLGNVHVTVNGTGSDIYSAVSGQYTLTQVPTGSRTLSFSLNGYKDTTLTQSFAKYQIRTGVDMVLHAAPDTNHYTSVSGSVTHSTASYTIHVKVTRVTNDTIPLVGAVGYNNTTNGAFSAKFIMPSNGGQVEVFAYDNGHLVGYNTIAYVGSQASVNVPVDGWGLLPTLKVAHDDTAYVVPTDTLMVSYVAADHGAMNASISSADWSCNNGVNWYPITSNPFKLPVAASYIPFARCKVRATDADGNSVMDSLLLSVEPIVEEVNVTAGADSMGTGINGGQTLRHYVTLTKSYVIGKTEVTEAQFIHSMKRELSSLSIDSSVMFVYTLKLGGVSLADINMDTLTNQPASWTRRTAQVSVAWHGAAYYCNALSREQGLNPVYNETTWQADYSQSGWRLPTNAEWEFAAMGGASSSHYVYSGGNVASAVAWWLHSVYSSFTGVQPVCLKTPNELGICDMSGNAQEWVNDWDGPITTAHLTDPTGPASGTLKVLKGGNAFSDAVSPSYLEPGNMYQMAPTTKDYGTGFRIVRNAP